MTGRCWRRQANASAVAPGPLLSPISSFGHPAPMPGCGRWPGRWAPLLLAALLLLAHPRGSAAVDIGGAVSNAAQAVKGVFGGGGNESNGGGGSQASAGSAASFGPIVAKTARAAAALAGLGSGNATVHQLPLGDAANVTLIKDPSRPHSLVLAFEAAPSLSADGATNSVPFLERFAATAEAPQTMLEAFLQGVEGPGTQGALADVSTWRCMLSQRGARSPAQLHTSIACPCPACRPPIRSIHAWLGLPLLSNPTHMLRPTGCSRAGGPRCPAARAVHRSGRGRRRPGAALWTLGRHAGEGSLQHTEGVRQVCLTNDTGATPCAASTARNTFRTARSSRWPTPTSSHSPPTGCGSAANPAAAAKLCKTEKSPACPDCCTTPMQLLCSAKCPALGKRPAYLL